MIDALDFYFQVNCSAMNGSYPEEALSLTNSDIELSDMTIFLTTN